MTDKYEHDIKDSGGNVHPFALTVESKGVAGKLVWPPENSTLEKVRRLTPSRITALIVWPTMKVRCWIEATVNNGATDLTITFVNTPYNYIIDDAGKFVEFIARLDIPGTGADEMEAGEQPAPPGGTRGIGLLGERSESSNCGNKVYVEDRSANLQYAYFYLVNNSDKKASVTILKTWIYDNQEQSDPQHFDLYEREFREVFSFPRNQNPKCTITFCNLS